MDLLEIYTPELDSYVKYKILDTADIDSFVQDNEDTPKDEYVRLVLEMCVFNLRSEVTEVLRLMDKGLARDAVNKIYNGCVMLNPGLDVNEWLNIANYSLNSRVNDFPPPPQEELPPPLDETPQTKKSKRKKQKPITKAKFLGLESYLKNSIIGQNEAINSIVSALGRSIAGLSDENKPLGTFLFAGASGVGKSQLAKVLHDYLFSEANIVRIDCGEFQHKHENQKLTGSPPGFVGYDDGGHLTNQMKENSHTVVLLDEVEKAHPDIWDTFLRVFEEGLLTDSSGNEVSFRNSIIIMTTNLGNKESVSDMTLSGVGFGSNIDVDIKSAQFPERKRVENYAIKAIRKRFRPEFLNRLDKIIVFNHLTHDILEQIADIEMEKLEIKLGKKGITLNYDESVIKGMIKEGVNPVEGARGLERVRRESIENVVSDKLLSSRWPRGTIFYLAWKDNEYIVEGKRPPRKKQTKKAE